MIVTLLTDFGTADHFVAAMKGVILSRDRRVTLVDVTHEVPPQDVPTAAFMLLAVYDSFPAGTVHLAVVDPGVGSARRPLVISAGEQWFVGPDNGLFSYVYEREPGARVFHLTNRSYFRSPVSATFHGRDIFAPVAAALATGTPVEELGAEIGDYVRLAPIRVRQLADGWLESSILHIDHFGNCITGLTRADLPESWPVGGVRVMVNGREIRSLHGYYAEEGTAIGDVFAIWGSAGFLEIVAYGDSAARRLEAERHQPVTVSTR